MNEVSQHNAGPAAITVMLLGCLLMASASARTNAVRSSEFIQLDDIARSYLLVRGDNRDEPVLLWLHGGPGGPERPLLRYFNGELERDFVVAYWDQRGAARSFDAGADPGLLTVEQHLKDMDVIVDHLRATLQRDRINIVGHSWGGALGLLYARRHPAKIGTLIAVAPLIDSRQTNQARYDFVEAEAARREDSAALELLRGLGQPPFATAQESLKVEQLADKYGAVFHQSPNKLWIMTAGFFRGLLTPWELPRFIRGNNASLDAMHAELSNLNLSESVPAVSVPVYFLLGRHDKHVDSNIAARYFKSLTKPQGRVIWFEKSAHNVPFEEPEAFNQTIRELLLPQH